MMPQIKGTGCGRESDFRFRYVSVTLQRLLEQVKHVAQRTDVLCSTARRAAGQTSNA